MTNTTPVREQLAAWISHDGATRTGYDGVQVFRATQPVVRTAAVYTPSLCILVDGTKLAHVDGRTHTYDAGHYLVATMPLPVETELPVASPRDPVVGLLVDLESHTMAELLVQHRAAVSLPPPPETAGMMTAAWDLRFSTALHRLIELLGDADALQMLGSGRLRELLYAVLTGPAGPLIHHSLGGYTPKVGKALTYIRHHLDQPLSVDELAREAGMSRAAFDRHFKAATTLSPLKYIKALRLNDAATRIAGGTAIAHAASRVGYSSPSQFSREFKTHFGATPRQWATTHHGILETQATPVTG